jgi:putative copper export protein
MLLAGMLLLLRALFARAGDALRFLALAASMGCASYRRLLRRVSRSLHIAARYNALILVLYHSFKIPDRGPA